MLSRLVPPSDSTPSSTVSSLSASLCPKTQAVSTLLIEAGGAPPLCNGKTRLMTMKNADHDSTRRENTRKRHRMQKTSKLYLLRHAWNTVNKIFQKNILKMQERSSRLCRHESSATYKLVSRCFIIIIINPLTARVVGAP